MRASAHLTALGGLGLSIGLLALPAIGIVIPGDPADGKIRFDNGTVDTSGETIALGHRGTNGVELVSGILLFELPDLGGSSNVNDAALQFSFLNRSGSFSTNPANVDIWGLGFVATTAIDTNWHLLGDTDTRTGNNLGTGIGTNPVIKISDNFLTEDSNEPTDDPYRMALPGQGLTDFIKLVYDQGAVSGNYAVIRVNVDEATSIGNRGFDIASANASNETARPVLSINENTILLLDPFTDGDLTNGADPRDTDWYTVTSSLTLSVVDDSGGIGDGNALNVNMGTTGRRFVCGFPGVTLANPGDFIQLHCTFRPTLALGSTEAFRMGLMTARGSPVTENVAWSSGDSPYEGYLVRMSTDGITGGPFGDLSTVGMVAGTFLAGSTDFLSRFTNALVVAAADVHTLQYTITRASTTQMTTRIELSNPTTDVVLNGMDPGTDADTNDWTFVDTFDAVGMGVGNDDDRINFRVDNVVVETSVPLFQVVPHTNVLADVVELEVETQRGIRYALQEASDLVTSNWTGTGYILNGDGTFLRVYDPNAIEPSKTYRMENQP